LDDAQRPIVYLADYFQLNAMLDTGSLFPVWVENEDFLKNIGGIPIAYNQPFGGFGGMATGTLYRVPIFRCGELMFPEFPIIASQISLPCQMLLTATMFSGLIYEVDDCHHRFNVTIPDRQSCVRKLTIEDSQGRLHVLCVSGEEDASKCNSYNGKR
jgi:hypothetical protein